MATRRRKPIRIKPGNRGKLRKSTGTRKGRKVPISTLRRLAKSGNKTTKKRAVFALNVRTGKIGGKKR